MTQVALTPNNSGPQHGSPSCLWMGLSRTFHRNGITHCVAFCVWPFVSLTEHDVLRVHLRCGLGWSLAPAPGGVLLPCARPCWALLIFHLMDTCLLPPFGCGESCWLLEAFVSGFCLGVSFSGNGGGGNFEGFERQGLSYPDATALGS